MTAQEKLNKIDVMLFKYGFREPGTVGKVVALIKEHGEYKNAAEYNERKLAQITHLIEFGYIDE